MKTKATKEPWLACDRCGRLLELDGTLEDRKKYVPGTTGHWGLCDDCQQYHDEEYAKVCYVKVVKP